MITIEGLTTKQKTILDIMWSMETKEQVQSFIHSLPVADAQDASSLMEILIHDSLEAQGDMEQYENYAKAAVSRARLS